MAKRGADRQINADNWDEEDETEEAGIFREATKEELQKRQFRRAKRRLAPGEASKVVPVFQGFAGFAPVKANPVDNVATASILPRAGAANGSAAAAAPLPAATTPLPAAAVPLPVATTPASQLLSSSSVPAARSASPAGASQTKPAGGSAAAAAPAGGRDPQFSVELKSLNEAVLDWIGMHLKKNAYCILTPVFEDYESHLEKLQAKYPTSAVAAAAATNGSAAVSAGGMSSSTDSDRAPAAKPAVAAGASGTSPKSTTFTFQAAAPTSFAGFTKPPASAVTAVPAAAGAGSAPSFAFGFSSNNPFGAFGSGANATATGMATAAVAAPSSGALEAKSENKEQAAASTTSDSKSVASGGAASTAAAGLFKFGGGLPSTQSSLTGSSLFQFGTKAAAGAPSSLGATSSLFQFGTKAASSGSDRGGSTVDLPKPGTSFLFQNIGSKPGASSSGGDGAAAGGDDAEDNEEYVPPKPEVVSAITEEGSVYSKRVKLFYKKDDSYVDKGIGNLFIKKVDTKTQLVLRADTNLGNILLNIVLNDKIPVVRQGTNNVSLVCIANPPMDPKLDATKPVALLLRVKSAADADELAEELNKHKK